jgi:hypothetical protein
VAAYLLGDVIDSLDGPVARATGTVTALGEQLDHEFFDMMRPAWTWASILFLLPPLYQCFWMLVLFRFACVGANTRIPAVWKLPIVPLVDVAWYAPLVVFALCGGFSSWGAVDLAFEKKQMCAFSEGDDVEARPRASHVCGIPLLSPISPFVRTLSRGALEIYIGLMYLTWGMEGTASPGFRADLLFQCLAEAWKCDQFRKLFWGGN